MSRRTTPSSDEFRDDLDFDVLTWENELAREQARQQRRRQAGLQRDLSERLEGHTTPLAVGVGWSPLVTQTGCGMPCNEPWTYRAYPRPRRPG